ncbi:tRNA (adenosine(37)-N6)-threonylcarbamoyltransferase complex dimerization subunit type 1 TsaB [Devosia algicola]|uniref:tRNA (Adenosine(37)-N6)-threonylcarbamoyltransferase complex dimerization subunit type 1 TsaB n=1 Tax=Devosia algicola TaxID=3026418 RepID=A0ABY7YLF4_9HYPH|nr:tRNA (adenosine(37)-N6)-threonylcarbamoyltransferase complex dimerization subunit type 1 TsaB [Devosia algicola]WDR02126.1 tRNA (adenosine(37)-N6)-threonylcarbamoyltransferase complex dimerization subunit type 1 TsaB [Devosia algicola]
MNIALAIDTAAPRLQLALLHADGRTDQSVDDITTGHAELIFARIAALLARNDLVYADLDRIVVTTGPGSFTGLRIGLSAARGIALARQIPVIGVPSLLAISLAAPKNSPVSVLLDARRGEAYVQNFDAPGHPADAARLCPMEIARANLPNGAIIIESPFVDIVRLAQFGAKADPAAFAPVASYVRHADAKPQNAARIARVRLMMKLWMAPAGLHIEPGQTRDAADLAKLHKQGFYRGWSSDEFAGFLAEATTPTYVACDAKRRIAGFAMFRLSGDEAELLTIAVDPKWRGKKVATALLHAAFTDLMMSPVKTMFLEVDELNEPALALYRREGFEKVGSRKGYYPKADGSAATALVMSRNLG